MSAMGQIGHGAAKSKAARRKLKRALREEQAAKNVSLASCPWDMGADGPANQHRLRHEPATDIDPETGKETPNPNGVMRRRRDDWVTRYERKGKLTRDQAAAAAKLHAASEGMRDKDPLAAIGPKSTDGYDSLAAHVDRRAYFRELWAQIPAHCKPVVERVVIEDQPIWHGNPSTRDRHMQQLREGLDAIS